MSAEAVERSWKYLRSWTDDNYYLNGIIATYWDSSTTCTLPHVMNHFPVVEGFCILHAKFGDPAYREKAEQYARFLVDSCDETTGIFQNAWGDVPGKITGVVHQAAAAGALIDVYAVTGEQKYLDVAVNNLSACRRRWPGLLLNGVANQALKYIQALMKLKQFAPEEFQKLSGEVSRYCMQLGHIVQDMPGGGKLIDQSMYLGFLMTVYEAKCLHGLKALVDGGIEREWARELLSKIVKGIVDHLYVGKGLFLSHIEVTPQVGFDVVRYGAAVLRRLPWPDQGLWVERLRRFTMRRFSHGNIVKAPVWLARIADLAYVFRQVQGHVDTDLTDLLAELDRLLLESQLSHGGIPNCIGPWKTGMNAWERHVCSTRWNAYVFRYFCSICVDKPDLQVSSIEPVEWGDAFVRMREDQREVRCRIPSTGDEFVWSKP